MKAKVIIENGKAMIILTPENEFEKNMIETAKDQNYKIEASISREFSFGNYEDHKIELLLTENKKYVST